MNQEDALQRFIEWEKSRRRPDAWLDQPLVGLGWPSEELAVAGVSTCTMYVPSSTAKRVKRVRGGRFAMEEIPERDLGEEIKTLRQRVIRSFATVDGILRADLHFCDYAANLLCKNYRLEDHELERMLAPPGWHQPIIEHLFNGAEALKEISEAAPELIAMAEAQSRPRHVFTPPPINTAAPQPRESMLTRAGRALGILK